MAMLALTCLIIAGAGCLYLVGAMAVRATFKHESRPNPVETPPVTILKPLRGAEPRLYESLASFCVQDYPAPVQVVFGVQDGSDAAIGIVERLRADFPALDTNLVIDPTAHGTNRKISNLVNMTRVARQPVIVLADSDIVVPPDYLLRIAAALEKPGVGGVTCLYRGIPAAGLWSRLAVLAIDAHFLPNTLIGLRLRLAEPCFGSTIALRRERLDEIGGFAAFADCLADDYALGAALRAKGWKIAVPGFLVGHHCTEASFLELWRHELRWARTIRGIDPRGYLGSLITHPLPFALFGVAMGLPAAGLAMALVAVLCRIVLLHIVSRGHGRPDTLYWLVPMRDLLSFAVFAWSFCGRGLTWRGRSYHVRPDGTLTAD